MKFYENTIIKECKKFSESYYIVKPPKNMKSLSDKIFENLSSLEQGLRDYMSRWTDSNGTRDEFIKFRKGVIALSMIIDKIESFPCWDLRRLKPTYFNNEEHVRRMNEKFKLKPNEPIRMFKNEITF